MTTEAFDFAGSRPQRADRQRPVRTNEVSEQSPGLEPGSDLVALTSFVRKALPPGFELWTPDTARRWPTLDGAAWLGPIGDYLTLVGPETEASPAAVGIGALVRFGALLGQRAVVDVGEHRHHANLFAVVVGDTSTGAKGTADVTNRPLFAVVDSSLEREVSVGGFGSGEALVGDLADSDDDPGVKRRLIHEAEFSAVLRVGHRDSSILSEIIRKGFEHTPIQHRTKGGGRVVATRHHLAVLGSITPDELAVLTAELDVANGWLNRFLLVWSDMPHLLPFGGLVDRVRRDEIAVRLAKGLDEDRHYYVLASTELGARWSDWYQRVRRGTGHTAFMRSLTARQHAHAARLMAVYAASMGADRLNVEHFDAARAWTDYSVRTALTLFGDRFGGDLGRLLDAIRAAGPVGLNTAAQHAVFGRHMPAAALTVLRDQLLAQQQIVVVDIPTRGRSAQHAVAITPKGST